MLISELKNVAVQPFITWGCTKETFALKMHHDFCYASKCIYNHSFCTPSNHSIRKILNNYYKIHYRRKITTMVSNDILNSDNFWSHEKINKHSSLYTTTPLNNYDMSKNTSKIDGWMQSWSIKCLSEELCILNQLISNMFVFWSCQNVPFEWALKPNKACNQCLEK